MQLLHTFVTEMEGGYFEAIPETAKARWVSLELHGGLETLGVCENAWVLHRFASFCLPQSTSGTFLELGQVLLPLLTATDEMSMLCDEAENRDRAGGGS